MLGLKLVVQAASRPCPADSDVECVESGPQSAVATASLMIELARPAPILHSPDALTVE